MKKKIQIFLLLSITISIFIIIFPFILNIPYISFSISWFLQPLKNANYKIAYIGFIGSILGTYLAISGAIWVQKRERKKKEKDEIIKNATIVYYDIKLSCLELICMAKNTICRKIYLEPNWIEKVAALPKDRIDIQKIYNIYGRLYNVKLKLENIKNNMEDINNFIDQYEMKIIFTNELYLDFCTSGNSILRDDQTTDGVLIERYICNDIRNALIRLEDIAEICSSYSDYQSQPIEASEPTYFGLTLNDLKSNLKLYLTTKNDTAHDISIHLDKLNAVLNNIKNLFSIILQSTTDNLQERCAVKNMFVEIKQSQFIENSKPNEIENFINNLNNYYKEHQYAYSELIKNQTSKNKEIAFDKFNSMLEIIKEILNNLISIANYPEEQELIKKLNENYINNIKTN